MTSYNFYRNIKEYEVFILESLFSITGLGMFFGMIGTTLGGVVGASLNVKTNKIVSFVLEFAAGLMTAIVCFDLIPEALGLQNLGVVIIGILFGIFGMIICDEIVSKSLKQTNSSSIIKTGIIIGIGLAVHNFPEGLAIGSGFEVSEKLGISLAIAIAIHDFPEGISIALPMKQGGMNRWKAIALTALSGITTGIGAFFGAIIGNISVFWISISLSFAAGTMLYIISCELIPESNSMYKGRFASFGNIIGIVIGILSKVI